MGFKSRRAKRSDEREAATRAGEFHHSSGATDLETVLGDHTLDDDAEPHVPKGYRGRTMGKDGASQG
jgi:hypothetical protein